jgi:hypothetical protein
MQGAEVGSRFLDVEVVDYHCAQGDPNLYQSHVFTIKIFVQQHLYAIERTYAAFCDLDARLRKQYARSKLPPLKLAGVSSSQEGMIKKVSSVVVSEMKKTAVIFPPDQEIVRHPKKCHRRVDTSEVIPLKKKVLTVYLQELMRIPEIVLRYAHFTLIFTLLSII